LPGGRVRDRLGQQVGLSGKTLEKAAAIVEAAEREPERHADLVEHMDRTGNVDAAHRELRARRIRERGEAERGGAPGVLASLGVGAGRYRTVYIDPPWRYRDEGCDGAAARHYPTMSLEELSALQVPTLAHEDGAHFWLWTTSPMVRDKTIHRVLEAWGLGWTSELYWNKARLLTGRWLRGQVEILVLAVAGGLPRLAADVPNYLEAPPGRHSEKPEAVYEILERFSPAPRVELFARRARQGWDRWGLECATGPSREGTAGTCRQGPDSAHFCDGEP
jgi:N6-adenosine-specific RNA methylase IME4